MQPAVITSKLAQNDLAKIRLQHAEIVRGIADQSARVNAEKQQRQMMLASQNETKMQYDQQKAATNNATTKMYLDHDAKRAELDIKRASISTL